MIIDDSSFKDIIEAAGRAIDLAGVLIVLGGLLVATVFYVSSQFGGTVRPRAYRTFRQQVGKKRFFSASSSWLRPTSSARFL